MQVFRFLHSNRNHYQKNVDLLFEIHNFLFPGGKPIAKKMSDSDD